MSKPIGGSLAIEVEMRKEKVSALKRVGYKLELALAGLHAVAESLPQLTGEKRRVALNEHERLRLEAEELRWYLVIQREAVGLVTHEDVFEQYPIPPKAS